LLSYLGTAMGSLRGGRAMPDYHIFVLKDGHIKDPAKIISCPDDEAATEEARQLLDGTDQALEVWQSDRRVTVMGRES